MHALYFKEIIAIQARGSRFLYFFSKISLDFMISFVTGLIFPLSQPSIFSFQSDCEAFRYLWFVFINLSVFIFIIIETMHSVPNNFIPKVKHSDRKSRSSGEVHQIFFRVSILLQASSN